MIRTPFSGVKPRLSEARSVSKARSPVGRFGQRRRIPDPHGPALIGRGDLPAVVAEAHTGELVTAGLEQGEDLPAGRRVPEPDAPVVPDGGKAAAVGAEGRAGDLVAVPPEAEQLLSAK